jgi:hypothetical protein
VLVAAASPQQSFVPFFLKIGDSRTDSESPSRRADRSAIGHLYNLRSVWSFSVFVSIRNLWTKIVSAGPPKPAPEPGALPQSIISTIRVIRGRIFGGDLAVRILFV